MASPSPARLADWVAEHRPFTLARDTEAEEMLATEVVLAGAASDRLTFVDAFGMDMS